MSGGLSLNVALPEGSGVPVVAVSALCHLSRSLTSRSAIGVVMEVLGSHKGEQSEQGDDEGCKRRNVKRMLVFYKTSQSMEIIPFMLLANKTNDCLLKKRSLLYPNFLTSADIPITCEINRTSLYWQCIKIRITFLSEIALSGFAKYLN